MFNQNNNNNNLNIFSQFSEDKKEASQSNSSQAKTVSNIFSLMSSQPQTINAENAENSLKISNDIFAGSQQKNAIENIFGQSSIQLNNQSAQYNSISTIQVSDNTNNGSSFSGLNQNLFKPNNAQNADNQKNLFNQSSSIFNPTATNTNNDFFLKKQSQNQSPIQSNLSITGSSPFNQQVNLLQNSSLFGNQLSIFQANQNKSKSISPINTISNTQVQEIKPQKLDFQGQQVVKTVEQQIGNLLNRSESPKFGISKDKSQQDQIFNEDQNLLAKDQNKREQQSGAQDTDSIDNLDFNDIKSEDEDDQGLADFPNKPFVVQQTGNQEVRQSRFESNRQEDEDDQNLEDFGPRDTRVVEQDLSVQKEQRVYQKIDMQKKISDLEIENDYYRKQINTQQKNIQDLQNKIQQILQDHTKVLNQQKESFSIQLKKADSATTKAIEQSKAFEKRYGFEIMKIALMRKMELTKSGKELQNLREEIEKTKIILSDFRYKNSELEKIKQQYLEGQKVVQQNFKIEQKYQNILEQLNSFVIKYNNQEIKLEIQNTNLIGQLPQIDFSSQILKQHEQETLNQLEQILIKYQIHLKMQNQSIQQLPHIQTQLQIEKQKQQFEVQKLQQQVQQQVLQNLKIEEENREIKSKFQEQENINYKNTKVNEELKAYYNCLIEKEKNQVSQLKKEKNLLMKFFVALAFILAGFIMHFFFF